MRRILGLMTLTLAACTTPERQAPSFATSFDVPESDGILVDWTRCAKENPCLAGEVEGQTYVLGFDASPHGLVGMVAGKPMTFALDPRSVFRLGDHGIEMVFNDAERTMQLDLTWNEEAQTPVDFDLIPAAH